MRRMRTAARTMVAGLAVLASLATMAGFSAAAEQSARAHGERTGTARAWVDWWGTERTVIRHVESGKRVVPADWVTHADYPVRIWEGATYGTHEWDITFAGRATLDGRRVNTYEIRNARSGRCLQESPVATDQRVWQVTCSRGSVGQQWILPDAKYGGEDAVRIIPAGRPGKALEPVNSAWNPSDLHLQDRSGDAEQVWRIEH